MSRDFYTAPSYMTGGYTVYSGSRRQRGGKLFGSFRNIMAPMGKQLLSGIKKVAQNKTVRNVARKVAEKSAEVAASVAIDALQGRNIGDSIKERALEATINSISTPEESRTPQSLPHRKQKLKQKKQNITFVTPPHPTKAKSRKRSTSIKTKLPTKKRRRLSRAALNRRDLF